MGCGFGCCLRVMHGAMFVRANGQVAAKLLAINDDGRFGGFAWHDWFRVWVVNHVGNLSNVAALHCSRSLFLGIAPAVLDLDDAGVGRDLAVKESLNLAVVAGGVEALCGIRATGKCFPLARRRRAPA
jgi:hypothetical protein